MVAQTLAAVSNFVDRTASGHHRYRL
jgi:hypothetical protein